MRLTVLDDDPGIRINAGKEHCKVLLDGIEVKRCLTADDEKGEVIVCMIDEKDRLLTENGEVKRQTLHGNVLIEYTLQKNCQ